MYNNYMQREKDGLWHWSILNLYLCDHLYMYLDLDIESKNTIKH